MSQKIIDLSVSIDNNPHTDPEVMQSQITYLRHKDTVKHLAQLFPSLTAEELPEGELWQIEHLSVFTHNGTHLDAPIHYASQGEEGQMMGTVEDIPLDWCLRPGVKLDFRHLEDGYIVQPEDIDQELTRINYTLQPLDIVLINTRAGSVYGTEEYLHAGCGMGRDATLHLLNQGIRVTGTDAWSWDAPLSHVARRYAQDGDASIIWEGHKAGRTTPYCHLEKLHQLEQLPATGFTVSCFPVKIEKASAGWTRAVAILEE